MRGGGVGKVDTLLGRGQEGGIVGRRGAGFPEIGGVEGHARPVVERGAFG